jgi:pimeloyl-ACP methyl ester carboxylesterase
MVDKLILGSFGGRPSKKMLETIEKGQIMIKDNRGDELGHLIIDTFGQRISDLFKRTIISQFKNMDEQKISTFYANAELIKNVRDINKKFDLSRITAKTLIVNGELDTIIDLEDIKFASAQFADCEIRMVPDTGHFLHHEKKEILEIYHEFFSMKNACIAM